MKFRYIVAPAIVAAVLYWGQANFLEASTRSRVSRAKADMRSLSVAIESYAVDNFGYPVPVALKNTVVEKPYSGQFNIILSDTLREHNAEHVTILPSGFTEGRHGMTTPIAYMTMNYPDPFTSWPFGYATKDGSWIVYSAGENLRYDCNPADLLTTDTTTTLQRLAPYTYDPTNGKVSAGDIFRFHCPDSTGPFLSMNAP